MSFFDEDDDEPRGNTATRPRRTIRAPRSPGAADQQTLLVRRGLALGGALLILILLVIAVRGCLQSQQESALKDYNRSVNSIVEESSSQVGEPFFALLDEQGGESPQDLQTAISGFRVQADQQLSQAEKLDVPGEMEGAQRSLLIELEFRRNALAYIAQRIRTAKGDEGDAADEAITQITGQMQGILASDTLQKGRVAPLIRKALDDAEIGGQQVRSPDFLPTLDWLSPSFVADKLSVDLSAGGGNGEGGSNREPAPGLHGTGIDSVSAGDTALQAGQANRIPLTSDLAFNVKFTNQGENDEFDVKTSVRIAGAGKPITISRTVDTVNRGQTATASIPLGNAKPPTGEAVTITVTVAGVPGEQKTDNNKQEFQALFVSG